MENVFTGPILKLKEADLPFQDAVAYLSQGEDHQILFMQFDKDVELPEHSHEDQWAVVLEGNIELVIDGITHVYGKGDRYHIPAGVKHRGRIFAGYADITFFNQKDRYKCK